jgi:hypothetical protein
VHADDPQLGTARPVNGVADAGHSGQLDIFRLTGLLFQADTDHEKISFDTREYLDTLLESPSSPMDVVD